MNYTLRVIIQLSRIFTKHQNRRQLQNATDFLVFVSPLQKKKSNKQTKTHLFTFLISLREEYNYYIHTTLVDLRLRFFFVFTFHLFFVVALSAMRFIFLLLSKHTRHKHKNTIKKINSYVAHTHKKQTNN